MLRYLIFFFFLSLFSFGLYVEVFFIILDFLGLIGREIGLSVYFLLNQVYVGPPNDPGGWV
jgi:hypothetical protein